MASFTSHDGVEIAYDDAGPREGRAALLVHGFASNRHEAWKRTGWYAAFERRGLRGGRRRRRRWARRRRW